MSESITLQLPDELAERARNLARQMGRPMGDLLAETIDLALSPLGTSAERSVSDLSDEEVRRLANHELDPTADARLSDLLVRQKSGDIQLTERAELNGLMQVYQRELLRKSQAVREAVRRGLSQPPTP